MAGHQGGRLGKLNTPKGETPFWYVHWGHRAGRETRRGDLQAVRPKQLFPVGWGSKQHFLAEGRSWHSKVPMRVCLVFLQATKVQKVAGGDSKAGGKAAAWKQTYWLWAVAVIYLFLINLPQPVNLAFLWERFLFTTFLHSNKLLHESLGAFWCIAVCLLQYLTEIVLTCIYFCLRFFPDWGWSLVFILQTWRDVYSRIDCGMESFIAISVYKPKSCFLLFQRIRKKQTDLLLPWKIGP